MKQISQVSVGLVLAAAIAACGQAGNNNASVAVENELPPAEAPMTNALENAVTEPQGNALEVAPPSSERATNPASDNRSGEADDTRRPPPKASRPQPEPDPHAGHDMGNMANMSHD